MTDRARGGKHHIFRMITALQKALEVAGREPLNAVGRAENRAAHGLPRKRRVVQEVVGHVIRAVARGGNLLQNHLALAVELGTLEGGVLQDVGDEPERDALVALEHAGKIGRRLEARRRI